MLTREQEEKLRRLRGTLHGCPELSGREEKTRGILMDFLRGNTSLEVVDQGLWFYAAHREGEGLPGIAFRADFDAVPAGELPEGAAHRCGHDGHAAALCGLGLLLEGQRIGKNVFLLFQFGEESGEGGEACCAIFARERIGEIYGAHNLPGFPLGRILTRPGTMACGSCGMIIRLTGRPTHAAYPENGLSPAGAVGKLLCALPSPKGTGDDLAMVTVIGCRMGERAFGVAAHEAELWLTLRAGRNDALEELKAELRRQVEELAGEAGLRWEISPQDEFPATENWPEAAEKVLALGGGRLDVPMRWSEDFGWYLRRCRGCFVGIGAGEDCPALHTAEYRYPDALLSPTAEAFYRLAQAEPLPEK